MKKTNMSTSHKLGSLVRPSLERICSPGQPCRRGCFPRRAPRSVRGTPSEERRSRRVGAFRSFWNFQCLLRAVSLEECGAGMRGSPGCVLHQMFSASAQYCNQLKIRQILFLAPAFVRLSSHRLSLQLRVGA